jgi:hypothetical protein
MPDERHLSRCGFSHARPGPTAHIKDMYGHTETMTLDGVEWKRERVTRIVLDCGHEIKGSDIHVQIGDYFFCVKCRDGVPK